jgi:hypothetical protein
MALSAFYLDHQAEIAKYLEETEREFEGRGITMSEAIPSLWSESRRRRLRLR